MINTDNIYGYITTKAVQYIKIDSEKIADLILEISDIDYVH